MLRAIVVSSLCLGVAILAAPVNPASAATPQNLAPWARTATNPLLENVHFRRCRFWRQECAFRWGWGSWRFERCMYRHGC